MKKSMLTLAITATLLLNYSFGQATQKGGSNNGPKDAVQSEMSGDAASTAKEWTQKMDEICDLTPDQEKKIMEINLRYAKRLQELKDKYKGMENPNADAAKSEKDELTKQRFKEYSNVLTKEQMQKFKEYRQGMKGDDNNGSKANKDDMKEKYQNATPEEKQQMKDEMKTKKDKKTNSSSSSSTDD